MSRSILGLVLIALYSKSVEHFNEAIEFLHYGPVINYREGSMYPTMRIVRACAIRVQMIRVHTIRVQMIPGHICYGCV